MRTPPASKWATLRNGRRVIIRSIRSTDAAALVTFHEGLSEESKRLRFLTFHKHLTSDEVSRFTEVDHVDREALIALSLDTIVGVGRFDRTRDQTAEVAFAVADSWQRLGVATHLLERLGVLAEAVGITGLEADTLTENQQMLKVFAHWAPDKKMSFDHGVVHIEMPLTGVAAVRS